MRKFLFTLPTLLALTAFIAAEPPAQPTDDGHAGIALRLALELAKAAPVKTPDPFVSPAKPKKTCDCADTGVCTCGADCGCPNCVARKAPKIGDQKVTDDPNRPWTYGYGREYGYDELGWYRPLVTAPAPQPIRYFAPVMSSFGGCSSGG